MPCCLMSSLFFAVVLHFPCAFVAMICFFHTTPLSSDGGTVFCAAPRSSFAVYGFMRAAFFVELPLFCCMNFFI